MTDYTQTTGSTARQLGLSTTRVRQLHTTGVLDAIRDSSGRRLFGAKSVSRYASERAKRPASRCADVNRLVHQRTPSRTASSDESGGAR